MDFDEICYVLDIIDDYVSDFMQDTWLKDELSKLLDEKECPDVVMKENNHHNITTIQLKVPNLVEYNDSQNQTQ